MDWNSNKKNYNANKIRTTGFSAKMTDYEYRKIEELKKMAERSSYNPKIYEQGQKWFESGLSLEDAPEELKNDRSFQNGFRRGERLASIAQDDNKGNNPSR